MHKRIRNTFFATVIGLAFAGLITMNQTASAADGEFSLQVSPSPLVTTLKPGQTTTVDLKIRNTGSQSENLKIATRSFTVDDTTGDLRFDDTKESEIASWTKFGSPNFTVQPGQWFTQKITFAVPAEAGFSYSFALLINRQDVTETTDSGGRLLNGSVAVFTLMNIDRPGAIRELKITDFTTSQPVYEYLPAKLNIKFKNTGNTIAMPAGNVFIQRGSDDKTPISALPVNENSGYILPGSVRTLAVEWDDGFQVLRTATGSNGMPEEQLEWNWGNLSNLRIGYYTAKVVAVYNDGQRDVPITGEVGFWVFPWKLLLGLLLVLLLIGAGLWSILRNVIRLPKRKKRMRL